MASSRSPEIQLLIAALDGAPTTADKIEHLRNVIRSELDWPRLIRLSVRQGLAGVVYSAIEAAGQLEALPMAARAQLRLLYLSNAARARESVEQLAQLLERFDRERIDVLVIKGPALAMMAYNDLGARDYFDLDLLVRRADLVRAAELLIDEGFHGRQYNRRATASGFFFNTSEEFHAERVNRLIDLHAQLRDWYFPFGPDETALWSRSEHVTIKGREFRTLGATDYFLFICAHASKHGWAGLSAAADLAHLLHARPEVDQQALVEEATLGGYARMVLLGLCLCDRLAETPLAAGIRARIEADRGLKRSAESIIEQMLGETARSSGLRNRITAARSLNSARERIWMLIALACAPTTTDYAALPLPRALFPLYYALRPARLLGSLIGNAVARVISRPSPPQAKGEEDGEPLHTRLADAPARSASLH